jgi:dienelactone hydrolase
MRHSLIRSVRATLGMLMVAASLAACADSAAHSATCVAVPPRSVPGSRMPSVPLTAILTLPKGQPPYPAVILLHGCGGGISFTTWAARLADRGYVSIAPDSYIPRGVSQVCAGLAEQRVLTREDRAGDVFSTALWLRARSEIDGNRIGVVGFSNGG